MTGPLNRRRRRQSSAAETAGVSRPLLRWPSRDFFSELEIDPGEGHPVHGMLHREPRFRRLYRRAATLAGRVEPQVKTRDWMAFMDGRSTLHEAEIQATFNLGFENGVLLGRAEGLTRIAGHQKQNRREKEFRLALRSLLTKVGLPSDRAALPLLELAWALMCGTPVRWTGRRSRKRSARA